ncbi:rRNA maturation RNase YbeY [bacterium]|nr:rRNA maturation RNase YbeY [bacterium]
MEKIFDVLGFKTQEVSITFANDRFVRRLNCQYRGIDRPTDVLAFAMSEGKYTYIQPQLLGDVVISVETAKRQAEQMGHSLDRELMILLIHGILHLAGYDHIERKDSKKMKVMETKILEEMKGLNNERT